MQELAQWASKIIVAYFVKLEVKFLGEDLHFRHYFSLPFFADKFALGGWLMKLWGLKQKQDSIPESHVEDVSFTEVPSEQLHIEGPQLLFNSSSIFLDPVTLYVYLSHFHRLGHVIAEAYLVVSLMEILEILTTGCHCQNCSFLI